MRTQDKVTLKAATLAVALGAMTSIASAEPLKLTDPQADQIAAGTWFQYGSPTWIATGNSFLLLQPGRYWFDGDMKPPSTGGSASTEPTEPQPSTVEPTYVAKAMIAPKVEPTYVANPARPPRGP